MDRIVGRVVAVAGSQITLAVDPAELADGSVRIGAMMKAASSGRDVVGTISEIHAEAGPRAPATAVIDLIGEIVASVDAPSRFSRGVSRHPIAGAAVRVASGADLSAIHTPVAGTCLRIGMLHQDPGAPAFLLMNELLGKHFAVVGTTGTGKSCAVTVILSAILAEHGEAHVVLLDPHNEYGRAFGELAEVIDIDDLQLPFWLLDFEEAARLLIRGGTPQEQEAQTLILMDALIQARRRFVWEGIPSTAITVDTPVPFLTSDVLGFINTALGSLDKPDTPVPYLRLRTRIESLRDDRRFAFMFAERAVPWDTLGVFISRLLRIPPDGKPLTVVDLSGLPSEVTDVAVSLLCRLIVDFLQWSNIGQAPPVLIVCEEAHRYVPADERFGHSAAARVLMRIAKEGRKYGLSLGLVSQRPSELSPQALSQCGTLFALRLGNDVDREFVAKTLPDAARGMLAALPSLGTQEAIVSGESVPLPMRIRFLDLAPAERPRGQDADFSNAWRSGAAAPAMDSRLVDEGVRRWRLQTRLRSRTLT